MGAVLQDLNAAIRSHAIVRTIHGSVLLAGIAQIHIPVAQAQIGADGLIFHDEIHGILCEAVGVREDRFADQVGRTVGGRKVLGCRLAL